MRTADRNCENVKGKFLTGNCKPVSVDKLLIATNHKPAF